MEKWKSSVSFAFFNYCSFMYVSVESFLLITQNNLNKRNFFFENSFSMILYSILNVAQLYFFTLLNSLFCSFYCPFLKKRLEFLTAKTSYFTSKTFDLFLLISTFCLISGNYFTMLKWTVHKRTVDPSGSHPPFSSIKQLDEANRICSRRSLGNLSRPNRKRNASQEHRRISLGSTELSKSIRYDDKENPQLLTPRPHNFRNNVSSTPANCYGKLDFALRDLRNITPKSGAALQQINNNITPNRKRPLPKTPPASPNMSPIRDVRFKVPSTPFASTLPTFDLEYSPCGPDVKAIPTDMSGVTVADSFFNHPRYFNDNFDTIPASKRLKTSPSTATPLSILSNFMLDRKNVKNDTEKCNENESVKHSKQSVIEISVNNKRVSNSNSISTNNTNNAVNSSSNSNKINSQCSSKISTIDESFSSSALDDTALDKMIDAILESARKEKTSFARNIVGRKAQLAFRTSFRRFSSDSPTYTAADDPASDLSKFCDNFVISPEKLLEAGERTIILDEKNIVNEREIKTPEALEADDTIVSSNESNCHLKRQRAVRRKHNAKLEPVHDSDQTCERSNKDKDGDQMSAKKFITPKTPTKEDFTYDSFLKKTIDELAEMVTPIADIEQEEESRNFPQCNDVTSTTSKLSYESTPIIHATDLKASSTPTGGSQPSIASIRRCLSYSNSPQLEITDENSMEKRKSTASSTASSSISNYSRNGCNIGSVDLAIFSECNKLHIHGELLV